MDKTANWKVVGRRQRYPATWCARFSPSMSFIATLIATLIFTLAINWAPSPSLGQESVPLLKNAQATFGIITAPSPNELKAPSVHLGRELFWDNRLSASGEVACASCHAASTWGADSARYSHDANGKLTKRNSQTVFNSMMQPHLRWTGDRKSGAHQAEKSLTGSMGFAHADDVVAILKQHHYEAKFNRAFPSVNPSISPANYAQAIEAYETTLNTPAPFDRYLSGQVDALNEEQTTGLQIFMEIGCADCHSGRLLGGESLKAFGVHHDYWTETGSQTRDAGCFEATQKEGDRYRFRTAMLRNIEKTGPYFHDGSVATLREAIRVMAKVQLDRELDSQQIQSILAFLTTLTGEVPANYSPPPSNRQTSLNQDSTSFQLFQYGSMHETIGRQQHQGRVQLSELMDRPHIYAGGALEQLQGEITIVESRPIVTSVLANGTLAPRNDEARGLRATLPVGE